MKALARVDKQHSKQPSSFARQPRNQTRNPRDFVSETSSCPKQRVLISRLWWKTHLPREQPHLMRPNSPNQIRFTRTAWKDSPRHLQRLLVSPVTHFVFLTLFMSQIINSLRVKAGTFHCDPSDMSPSNFLCWFCDTCVCLCANAPAHQVKQVDLHGLIRFSQIKKCPVFFSLWLQSRWFVLLRSSDDVRLS